MQDASTVVPVPPADEPTEDAAAEPAPEAATTDLAATEPAATEPAATEPAATEPAVTVVEPPAPAAAAATEPAATSDLAATEEEPATDVTPDAATQEGPARRSKQRRHRRLQGISTTTVYDVTAPGTTAAEGSSTDSTAEAPVATKDEAASAPAPPASNTTKTIVAVPIELSESEGGSMLKVVCITDSETLAETYMLEFNLPGMKVSATYKAGGWLLFAIWLGVCLGSFSVCVGRINASLPPTHHSILQPYTTN